jgi:glycosyltransferase involved in cell wall biosynthesis
MRVLFITGEFPPMPGGVGACTQEIARALVASGAEVGVLTSTRAQPVIRNSREAFVIRPEISKWNWFSISKIARVMREFAPDVVHIQYQTGAFAMHPAINFLARLFPLFPSFPSHPKFVTTFHDLRVPYLFPKAGRVRDWVTRELARNCDAVIATNDDDHRQLLTFNLKLLTLIPIGSNVTTQPFPNYQREVWRAQIGVAENETLVGYFGFLNHSKGGETLIRALAQIPRAKLLLIGGQIGASDPTDVAYRARVQALSAELGLNARVIWTDFAPDEIISAHFHACDVIALPYRDGASYRRGTLMAALAHGGAIVTTVVSRQSSVVSQLPPLCDGENCLLIPPDDPHALATAIERAMASPELRAKIRAGARDLAQNFTWDKIARQHRALYQQIINNE